MKITFRYSVVTKEGFVFPNKSESITFENTDEDKKIVKDRFNELKDSWFISNLEYKLEDIPVRRVIKARYQPKGQIYHFEVNFSVRDHEGLEVDDLDCPNRRKYVFAVGKDYVATEAELAKEFDISRLRPAYKAS